MSDDYKQPDDVPPPVETGDPSDESRSPDGDGQGMFSPTDSREQSHPHLRYGGRTGRGESAGVGSSLHGSANVHQIAGSEPADSQPPSAVAPPWPFSAALREALDGLPEAPWYVETSRPGRVDEARIYSRSSHGVCKLTTGKAPAIVRQQAEYMVALRTLAGRAVDEIATLRREVERLNAERTELKQALDLVLVERNAPRPETLIPPLAWCEKCANWVTWTGHKCFQPSRFGL